MPVFSSVQEEAEFWDTHDSMDYRWEDVRDVVVRPREGTIIVHLEPEAIADLEEESASNGLKPAELARMLIGEGLAVRKARAAKER